jgi:aspartyl protease family protein
MGLTHIEADISNPAKPRQKARLRFLIDTGAAYSVIPARVLRSLGIKPHSRRTFILADGSRVSRRMGDVLFRYDGRQGASPVIFGQRDDSILLGIVSLEALGLIIDPFKRELRPLPMVLAEDKPSTALRAARNLT